MGYIVTHVLSTYKNERWGCNGPSKAKGGTRFMRMPHAKVVYHSAPCAKVGAGEASGTKTVPP